MVVGRKAFELAFFMKTCVYRWVKIASDATRRLEARLSRERIRRQTLDQPAFGTLPVSHVVSPVSCAASSFSSSHLLLGPTCSSPCPRSSRCARSTSTLSRTQAGTQALEARAQRQALWRYGLDLFLDNPQDSVG